MAICDIVIPYFQRKPGVLGQGLRSILDQSFTDYRVLIVDDGSPHPAEAELAGLDPAERARFQVVKKANGGVSSARNAGLDAVSEDARMVAFLDSDDVWTPDHLLRAHAAVVGLGADVFWDALTPDEAFGSFRPPSVTIPERMRRPEPRIGRGYAIDNLAKVMTGQWFRHMHLSCTAVSAKVAARVRFQDGRNICEDLEYYCLCAEVAALSIASDEPGTVRGAGENLWHGVDFFDPRTAIERLTTMKLLKTLRRSPLLDQADRDMLDLRIQEAREQFYWIGRDRLKAGKPPDFTLWADWLANDPGMAGTAASILFKTSPTGGRTRIPGDEA
jgi:succinoglycan biosynthesis protein ExoW